jgi:hypothetical protein
MFGNCRAGCKPRTVLPEYFMGRPLLSRTLPLGDGQTNLARFSFAVDADCRFALGRMDGNVPPS